MGSREKSLALTTLVEKTVLCVVHDYIIKLFLQKDIDELKQLKKNVIKSLEYLADQLDVKQRDMNIAKASFATSGIVGTGLAIGGAVAAPFTLGASLGLTIAGAAIGVASGLGGLATAIADHVVNSRAMKEAEAAIESYNDKVGELMEKTDELLYIIQHNVDDTDLTREEAEAQGQKLEIFLRGLRT